MNPPIELKLNTEFKMHRLRPLEQRDWGNHAVGGPLPEEFLIDLLNAMEISCAEYTDVYKNWPEMFEEEEQ